MTLIQEKDSAKHVHDEAQDNVIFWRILIGVGIVLIVIGILLTIYFGSQLIQAFNKAPKTKLGTKEVVREWSDVFGNVVETTTETVIYTITLTLGQIIMWTATQNWVHVILYTIGAILVLVGAYLVINGVYECIINSINWYEVNSVTDRNKEDYGILEEWLTPKAPNIDKKQVPTVDIELNNTIPSTIIP